jgi:hypothetical protein
MKNFKNEILNVLADADKPLTFACIKLCTGGNTTDKWNTMFDDEFSDLLSEDRIYVVKRNNIGVPLYSLQHHSNPWL